MSAQAATTTYTERDPVTEKMSSLTLGLFMAMHRHGKAVDATTVLDGIRAVVTMQEWMKVAERQNNESILSLESWCILANDAVHGFNLAKQELDKWS